MNEEPMDWEENLEQEEKLELMENQENLDEKEQLDGPDLEKWAVLETMVQMVNLDVKDDVEILEPMVSQVVLDLVELSENLDLMVDQDVVLMVYQECVERTAQMELVVIVVKAELQDLTGYRAVMDYQVILVYLDEMVCVDDLVMPVHPVHLALEESEEHLAEMVLME